MNNVPELSEELNKVTFMAEEDPASKVGGKTISAIFGSQVS